MSDPRFKDRPLASDVSPEMQRQLVRVMEECAELSIAASKILRFGPTNWHPASVDRESNTAAFRREMADLLEALTDLGEYPQGGESLADALERGEPPRNVELANKVYELATREKRTGDSQLLFKASAVLRGTGEPNPREDTAWLIERGQSEGWTTTRWWRGGDDWTFNANEAARFSTKDDAEATIVERKRQGTERATEHYWIGVAPCDEEREKMERGERA